MKSLPFPQSSSKRGHLVTEELERKEVETVRAPSRVEDVAGDHGVEIHTAQRHAGDAQREGVVLGILRRFSDGWILEQRSEWLRVRAE